MRFQVPQFIEVEDKVIGPFTFKQFLYLAGGAGLSFLLYVFLPLLLALPLIAGAILFSLALAFYKVNNRPFIEVVESWLRFKTGGKLYVWKKEIKKPQAKTKTVLSPAAPHMIPKMSESKLRDLAWSLDVHEFENENDERQTTNN